MPKQDLWRVRIGSSVVEMNLDELVAAFQGGIIEANTLVIAPGDLRWTTLSAVADLGDDDAGNDASPPSVAPMAYDTANVDIRFADDDVDLDAPRGTPKKKSRVGRVTGIVLAYAVLIAVGGGAGAYRAAPGEVRAKAYAVQAKVMKKAAPPSAAAPAAQPPPPPVAAPPPVAPTPPTPPPAATPVASPAPSPKGTSIDSLPTAKPTPSTKAAPAPAPRRRGR